MESQFFKTIFIGVFILFAHTTISYSQVNIKGRGTKTIKKNIPSKNNNSTSKNENDETIKTLAGDALESSAAYYYKSYKTNLDAAINYNKDKKFSSALSKTEAAGNALAKVQQKSDKELDLTLEYKDINDVEKIAKSGNSNESSEVNNVRNERNARSSENEKIKKEINAKYEEIKYALRKIGRFFKSSSNSELDNLEKGLDFFSTKKMTIKDIESMLNDQNEIKQVEQLGNVHSRTEVKDVILPGISNALNKNTDDNYNLEHLDDIMSQLETEVSIAKKIGDNADEKAEKLFYFQNLLQSLYVFTNKHSTLESYVKKTDYYASSVKKERNARYEKYRSGNFHKTNGSGIYFVQKDGITPEILSKSDVTNKIIIDGIKPVHIFILTDMNLYTYGSFLQFDMVDEGKNTNQHKYVLDPGKTVPITKTEQDLGYKKLIFIPSKNWGDLSENYVNSQFYQYYIQAKLADILIPGVPQNFTFYSANSKLKTTISIEITESGIAFLKTLQTDIKKYKVDAMRMEQKVMSDPTMEKKISSGFISNSNGEVTEVIKVIITSKPWFVEKNTYGVTLYKDFYAQVAFKKKDGKYYVQKVRCKKEMVNGSFAPMKVYGSGPSNEIRQKNI